MRRNKNIGRDVKSALEALRAESEVGLHLGAGSSKIDNLINCDLFNPDADRKVDATSLDEFEANSVDLIEHHHMIEHLSFVDFDSALGEWSRVLKPGAYLVFTCPDIERVCRHYLKLKRKNRTSDQSEKIDYAIKMIVGSQEHEGMFHKTHLDPTRARWLLPKYGFKIDFITAYPRRTTPSMLVVARKTGS